MLYISVFIHIHTRDIIQLFIHCTGDILLSNIKYSLHFHGIPSNSTKIWRKISETIILHRMNGIDNCRHKLLSKSYVDLFLMLRKYFLVVWIYFYKLLLPVIFLLISHWSLTLGFIEIKDKKVTTIYLLNICAYYFWLKCIWKKW